MSTGTGINGSEFSGSWLAIYKKTSQLIIIELKWYNPLDD